MASIAGLYGGYSANQEDGSGGRSGFFRSWGKHDNKGRGGGGGGGAGGGGASGNENQQGGQQHQQNFNPNDE